VSMEIWKDQQPQFEPEVEAGTIVDYGPNYPNSIQGWWVPTYVIEGDEERGIEPMAPDLSHVDDLPEYTDLFEDPEDPGKGRFYDCIAGWECQRVNESKFEFYGLDEHYNRFQPGSGAALATSLVSAFETGEPWLGYYWAPTWVFAVVDLTMIEEPEYTDECFDAIQDEEGNPTGEAGCAYPSVAVHKALNTEFEAELPQEILDFIDAYETTMEQNNEFLLYMNDNEIEDHEVAAIWFLQNNPEWQDWVPADVAEAVQTALDGEDIP
jgi:glycine betaine/proline transport system substrate-binding protein